MVPLLPEPHLVVHHPLLVFLCLLLNLDLELLFEFFLVNCIGHRLGLDILPLDHLELFLYGFLRQTAAEYLARARNCFSVPLSVDFVVHRDLQVFL